LVFVTGVPVASTVRLELAVLALVPLVRVSVETPLPGEETICGLKPAVTPGGNPNTDKATAELNPPKAAVVNFTVPFALELTVTLAALAVSEKPETFTVRVCFCGMPPPIAVTITE
jgi:hypothetical protein